MTTPPQQPATPRRYRPQLVPWVGGMATGTVMGVLFALLHPPLAIGLVLLGLAIGVAVSIAVQAAADDLVRRRR